MCGRGFECGCCPLLGNPAQRHEKREIYENRNPQLQITSKGGFRGMVNGRHQRIQDFSGGRNRSWWQISGRGRMAELGLIQLFAYFSCAWLIPVLTSANICVQPEVEVRMAQRKPLRAEELEIATD